MRRALVAMGFLPCLLALACEFPIAASKYEIDSEPGTQAARLARLYQAFSASRAGCTKCLENSCEDKLQTCSSTQGCVELAECALAKAHPGAYAECSSQSTPFEVMARYMEARECWTSCFRDCVTGANWDCVGNYVTPRPPKDIITVAQSFNFVIWGTAIANAQVQFCAVVDSCSPQVSATTDDLGSYRVELPIAIRGGLEGWHGARLIQSDAIFPLLQVRNLPLWSDHWERTYLMPKVVALAKFQDLAALVGLDAEGSQEPSVLWTQVFDCQGSEAGGVQVSVPTAPDASVLYTANNDLSAEATATAAGQGSAVVVNLPTGRKHDIEARRAANGDLVATGSIYVPEKGGLLLSLYPQPVPR